MSRFPHDEEGRTLRRAFGHPAGGDFPDGARSIDAVTPAVPFGIVAIPATDEAERIEACLAALAVQRDGCGAPLPAGSFAILVFANNCRDATADIVRGLAAIIPHPVWVVTESLPPERSNAGWARKRAMDLAADRLSELGRPDGVILTTDADSTVGPTWVAATLAALAEGVQCVAGYIDAHPAELLGLGAAFLRRGRLEDRYLRLVAEIYARCDPRPHDPWPNHRVSSGASLAVTRAAYLAIGGLPPKPLGEDAALTQALESAGFKVRHAMDVRVSTSCRFDGKARGGAADTMRLRHAVAEAPCDADIEPALFVVRRALYKGRLRRASERGLPVASHWARRLGLSQPMASTLLQICDGTSFEDVWRFINEASPLLRERHPLRPADLPRQIERATMCLGLLRGREAVSASAGQGSTGRLRSPAATSGDVSTARAASAMARSGTG